MEDNRVTLLRMPTLITLKARNLKIKLIFVENQHFIHFLQFGGRRHLQKQHQHLRNLMHMCLKSTRRSATNRKNHTTHPIPPQHRKSRLTNSSKVSSGILPVGTVRCRPGQHDKRTRVGTATLAGFTEGDSVARFGLHTGAVNCLRRVSSIVFGA